MEHTLASYKMGIDIGSTTVKVVLFDGEKILFDDYRRHHSDVRYALLQMLGDVESQFSDSLFQVAITGSGGLTIAKLLDLSFVQEVIAETTAIVKYEPKTDVIIELGGEDAKITYLHPSPEQRMNGTCAGGTGAFIDQMATLLQTDADGLNEMAKNHKNLYTIASRCGVFAKSDLQPLINEGADRADLAASIMQAVVNQTIAGLACGRPIRGHVAFLGGPLYFNSELREAFRRTLQSSAKSFTLPNNAQIYVALGAALSASGREVSLPEITSILRREVAQKPNIQVVPPLFSDENEKALFDKRHLRQPVKRASLSSQSGPCYIGIDVGSTTTKAVAINQNREIVYSYYGSNRGNPIGSARRILTEFYSQKPKDCYIAYSCVTGYGENMIRAAFGIEEGEIETMAHFQAAKHFCPEVDFIIDIGGQDMKCMRIRNGVIDSIMLNEACSSGCGSFIQTFAENLGLDVEAFAQAALVSQAPVDLGTRCTVFMNSKVKQAQKEGATVGDISAGLSYSVVRNALYKVIKIRDTSQLGENIVVQGGTFLNDAILRAFELTSKRDVIRPDIAGLMGAFGSALIAMKRCPNAEKPSAIISVEALEAFSMETELKTCGLCGNHCKLTVSTFSNGRRFVSGNRCQKGEGDTKEQVSLPNLFLYKYNRTFQYKTLPGNSSHRGEIGIPRVLNLYENYPFWHTVLTQLKFRVVLSGRSDHHLFEKGMESIPSESVCYPAKLVHGHIEDLIEKGVKTIFYPDIPFERNESPDANNHFNCPIVVSYPEVIRNNVENLNAHNIRFLNPFLPLENDKKLAEILSELFSSEKVTAKEALQAVEAGHREYDQYKADILQKGREALAFMEEHQVEGVVLAGRPYHCDPEIHHGIPQMINALGLAVLTEDSVSPMGDLKRPIRVMDQWMYHTRLYKSAAFAATREDLELVQLTSFGCGLDAVTSDQVQEILESQGKLYTLLKIDEVSNLGAARIRMRSLKVAMDERRIQREKADGSSRGTSQALPSSGNYTTKRIPFTEEHKKNHTILAPQMAPIQFEFVEAVLRNFDYRVCILKEADKEDIECGLRFVNNDACYPTIIVVGQLVNAFLRGDADPDNSSVMITQTGGGCRATNYVAFLRKALKEAGYPQVPVIALSVQGFEGNPGIKLSMSLLHRVLQGICYGDLLSTLLLRVRPYEAVEGAANDLYREWRQRGVDFFNPHGRHSELSAPYEIDRRPTERRMVPAAGQNFAADEKKSGYYKLIDGAVAAFDRLALLDIPRKPLVGLVGEILVKFQPDANNHVVDLLEEEGCEAVVPGLLDFFLYCFYGPIWNRRNVGTSRKAAWVSRAGITLLHSYRARIVKSLKKTGKFALPVKIDELAMKAQAVLSCGNVCGEGWFLTAEMIELIESGVPNIICAQPFACLPNHVTGKGMIKELRTRFPGANIVPIDYDPGASEANQLNRIKLMISTARANLSASATQPEHANRANHANYTNHTNHTNHQKESR